MLIRSDNSEHGGGLISNWLVPGILASLCLAGSLLQQYSFATNDFDLGLFQNLIWNIGHGNGYFEAVHEASFFAQHFSLLPALLAPVQLLFDSPYTLSAIHGLLFGLSFFVLARVCNELFSDMPARTRGWCVAFVLVSAFLYKPFMAGWRYQTHMTTLLVPVMFYAVLCLHRGWNRRLWVCVVLLLIGQERAAVGVACLGLYAILMVGRWQLGVVLGAVSTAYFFLVVKVVLPYMNGDEYLFAGRLGVDQLWDLKSRYLFKLVESFSFLPLLGLRATLAALPLVALNLVSRNEVMFSTNLHYDDLGSVFIILGAAVGLRWLVVMAGNLDSRAVSLGIAFVLLLAAGRMAYFSRNATPLGVIDRYWPVEADHILHDELFRYRDGDSKVRIVAQSGLGPHVNFRAKYSTLGPGTLQRLSELPAGTLILVSHNAGSYPLASVGEAVKVLDAGAKRIWRGKQLLVYSVR